jgi:hypothetical protein
MRARRTSSRSRNSLLVDSIWRWTRAGDPCRLLRRPGPRLPHSTQGSGIRLPNREADGTAANPCHRDVAGRSLCSVERLTRNLSFLAGITARFSPATRGSTGSAAPDDLGGWLVDAGPARRMPHSCKAWRSGFDRMLCEAGAGDAPAACRSTGRSRGPRRPRAGDAYCGVSCPGWLRTATRRIARRPMGPFSASYVIEARGGGDGIGRPNRPRGGRARPGYARI